ncbi:L,D-transpeptidase family protein [uncultured Clostridium sp.]|uniref:L,D-transpeptidase family protein n=1 Tax=uncultured Clostridium sp. TaxID=59620 RepID=UPI00258DA340|nr:L,D-transpeptidase family protein [uncultured Clostridium sp.]
MVKEFINRIIKNKLIGKAIIVISSIILLYLLSSMYFINHFFFNTKVNGVDLSLKNYKEANKILEESVKEYSIKIVGRDNRIEEIRGSYIELLFKEKDIIKEIKKDQNLFKWIASLINKKEYYIYGLVEFNEEMLVDEINSLDIVNKDIIEPLNVTFKYTNGVYEMVPEVYGNKINKNKLIKTIIDSVKKGNRLIDLDIETCYENPEYTMDCEKAIETKKLINQYISTKITYLFGENKEELSADIIYSWLTVDEDLNVVINEKYLKEYIDNLGEKYNTVGIERDFKTSIGKVIKVKGGYYGWKINSIAEEKMLLENIKLGAVLEKEPIYTQKALYRDGDDIGNTYVEINITRQYIWFYKEGKVVAEGSIVSGDPRKGYSTALGTYMINYKQKDAILKGPGYETNVTYWMPFNGNIGIHDASWRYSFGSNIYQNNGTHGCVNAPISLAKKIYDNIDAGTPVICYEE